MIKYLLRQNLSDFIIDTVIDDSFDFDDDKISPSSEDLNFYSLYRYVFMKIVYCKFYEPFEFNSVVIDSCSAPQLIIDGYDYELTLYVWGDAKQYNDSIIPIPIEYLNKIVVAITEYNKLELD